MKTFLLLFFLLTLISSLRISSIKPLHKQLVGAYTEIKDLQNLDDNVK